MAKEAFKSFRLSKVAASPRYPVINTAGFSMGLSKSYQL